MPSTATSRMPSRGISRQPGATASESRSHRISRPLSIPRLSSRRPTTAADRPPLWGLRGAPSLRPRAGLDQRPGWTRPRPAETPWYNRGGRQPSAGPLGSSQAPLMQIATYLLIAILAVGVSGCTTAPIPSFAPIPVPAGLSLQQVELAIVAGILNKPPPSGYDPTQPM